MRDAVHQVCREQHSIATRESHHWHEEARVAKERAEHWRKVASKAVADLAIFNAERVVRLTLQQQIQLLAFISLKGDAVLLVSRDGTVEVLDPRTVVIDDEQASDPVA